MVLWTQAWSFVTRKISKPETEFRVRERGDADPRGTGPGQGKIKWPATC